jgi:hypothetical protein
MLRRAKGGRPSDSKCIDQYKAIANGGDTYLWCLSTVGEVQLAPTSVLKDMRD